MVDNHRPRGVTWLAGFHYVIGVLALLFGVFSLFYGRVLLTAESSGVDVVGPITAFVGFGAILGEVATMILGPIITLVGLGMIINGVLSLSAGYGLAKLKIWGWTLAIALAVLNIINNGIIILFKEGATPWAIAGLFVSIFILYYLLRPTIKRAF